MRLEHPSLISFAIEIIIFGKITHGLIRPRGSNILKVKDRIKRLVANSNLGGILKETCRLSLPGSQLMPKALIEELILNLSFLFIESEFKMYLQLDLYLRRLKQPLLRAFDTEV